MIKILAPFFAWPFAKSGDEHNRSAISNIYISAVNMKCETRQGDYTIIADFFWTSLLVITKSNPTHKSGYEQLLRLDLSSTTEIRTTVYLSQSLPGRV